MDNISQLGERIRAERVAQGYSVKSAAEKSGIARDTWRKIEAGGSVHDTKRHIAMEFLGLSEVNTEWGTVGRLEDHAADLAGTIDLNLMFSQAVRFAATVGMIVPSVREEAERATVQLSNLFAHALELWDKKPLDERDDLFGADEPTILKLRGGDGNADADARGSAPIVRNDDDLAAADADEMTGEAGAEEEQHP